MKSRLKFLILLLTNYFICLHFKFQCLDCLMSEEHVGGMYIEKIGKAEICKNDPQVKSLKLDKRKSEIVLTEH